MIKCWYKNTPYAGDSHFNNAIVRRPGISLMQGLSKAGLGKPDIALAKKQHKAYIRALEKCGLSVSQLPKSALGDSVFVEDVAVILPELTLLTRPGALSRQAEVAEIETIIKAIGRPVFRIQEPGTLEGGDVLLMNKAFYIGYSARTNLFGIEQFKRYVTPYGYTVNAVPVPSILHLKTGVSRLDKENILITAPLAEAEVFQYYNTLVVPEEEAYAANVLSINGQIILPAGFHQTHQLLVQNDYSVITVDMSEYEKVDGGLTCLSLRY